jgi:hypothetical protein
LAPLRDQVVIATKSGFTFDADSRQTGERHGTLCVTVHGTQLTGVLLGGP